MKRIPILLLGLFALIFAGCGDNSDNFVFTNSQNQTGTLVFNFTQAQTTVPTGTTSLQFDFFDSVGGLLDSQVRSYSSQVVFTGVSTLVVRVKVTAFDENGYPLLTGTADVILAPGTSVEVTLSTIPVTLESFTCTPDPVTLTGTSTQQLSFQGTFTDESVVTLDPADAEYSGNATNVVTVSDSGLLSSVGAGSTTLTVSFTINQTTVEKTVNVTVNLVTLPSNAGTQVNDVAAGMSNIGASNTSRNIAISDDGGIHAVFVDTTNGAVRYTGSSNGGSSFSASNQVGTTMFVPDGGPVIAAGSGGNVYIAFVSAMSEVLLVRSSDGGATWGTPQVIAGLEAGSLSMATRGSSVYLAAKGMDIDLARSTDNGANFSTLQSASPDFAYFDVLCDPVNGDVYLIGDNMTVSYVRSTDGGASFGSVVTPGLPVLVYSDFAMTTISKIIGSQPDSNVAGFSVIDLLTNTASAGDPAANSDNDDRAVAVDADNTVFLTGATGGNCFYETADTNGNITSLGPNGIGSGAVPDVAGNPFVRNVGMLYNNSGNIFYFAP